MFGIGSPEWFIYTIKVIPMIIISITFHEFAHGFAAYKLGDRTAKNDGRLSLNPIRHLDPIGLVLMILFHFGWAKPVMVNPYNLDNPKKDMAIVASAGPLSNIVLAFVSMLILYPILALAYPSAFVSVVTELLIILVSVNVSLAVFNLIPIPPLDGSKILGAFLPTNVYVKYRVFERYGMIIVILLISTSALSGTLQTLSGAAFNLMFTLVDKIYFFL